MSEERETYALTAKPMPDFVKAGLVVLKNSGVYLKVAARVSWMRAEHPDWSIETEMLYEDDERAYAKAVIRNELGRILATAHKHCTYAEFKSGHRDKAETGAVGRALSFLGYGTGSGDLDEGDVVDSPVSGKRASSKPASAASGMINESGAQCPKCHAPAGKLHGKPCVG